MKKLAIASALAALTTTAVAQNVTVYGVIDASMQKYDTGSETLSRVNDNGLTTSRIGFRGTEDLGGGLKANFQLEGLISPNSGTVGSTTANQTFNREAWVGFSGGFGEVRLGRQDVTAAQDVDTFTSQAFNFGFRPTNGTSVELGTDQSNVVKYISPKFGGLSFQVGYASGNGHGATTDANADQKGVSVRYDVGALSLQAGYQKNDGATTAAERDFKVYGASYNFGVASVGASRAWGDTSTTGTVKSISDVLSVKVPLSNGFAVHGTYGRAEDGGQASANKGEGYALAVTKAFSKRTIAYAGYSMVQNQANATMNMTGLTTAAVAGRDPKSYTVGLSHTF